MSRKGITRIPGIRVGHFTDREAATGCTVVLCEAGAVGLDAASGVMRYLEERGIGLRVGGDTVPIVPAAILFDLGVVTGSIRPGPLEGYAACQDASSGNVAEGSVGAGTGATVVKTRGMDRSVKGGIGTSSVD